MTETLLNTRQVAEQLGVHHTTIERWRADGHGPKHIRVAPRIIRYRQTDIDTWLEELRRSRRHPQLHPKDSA